MNKRTVIALVMEKWKVDRAFAETLTADLFGSDFPMNGIKTYGQTIEFLDYVQSIREARAARTN